MKLKKWIRPLVILVILGSLAAYNLIRDHRPALLVAATGSPGGVYYPLGGAIAEVVSRNLPGVRLDSESTSGSVENVRLVGNGESDLGMEGAYCFTDCC